MKKLTKKANGGGSTIAPKDKFIFRKLKSGKTELKDSNIKDAPIASLATLYKKPILQTPTSLKSTSGVMKKGGAKMSSYKKGGNTKAKKK